MSARTLLRAAWLVHVLLFLAPQVSDPAFSVHPHPSPGMLRLRVSPWVNSDVQRPRLFANNDSQVVVIVINEWCVTTTLHSPSSTLVKCVANSTFPSPAVPYRLSLYSTHCTAVPRPKDCMYRPMCSRTRATLVYSTVDACFSSV